jgi:hypothetical protein
MAYEDKDVSKLRLSAVVEGYNYANVIGDYTRTDDTVRGKNLWLTQSTQRMMFYDGSSWVITSTQYMPQILDGSTGGFVSSSKAEVPYKADWSPHYNVSEVFLAAENRWVPVKEVHVPVTTYKAPSVHIWWSAPQNPQVQKEGVTWFYNEVQVKESADSTYYMTNGFTGGYMGIQDRLPKWVLFSIWDNPDGSKVKELAHGEGVTVRSFGGEGTGLQSFFPYDWRVGQTYQCIVNVRPDVNETDKVVFTGWFRIPEENIWRMLASLQVRPRAGKKTLEGIYSFIEDWAGNGYRRQGLYGPAWIRSDKGPWVQATHGQGTTTDDAADNRNVFLSEDKRRLGMTTGGPPLSDTSLGPYDVVNIPSVLTMNPLPDGDGAPARED